MQEWMAQQDSSKTGLPSSEPSSKPSLPHLPSLNGPPDVKADWSESISAVEITHEDITPSPSKLPETGVHFEAPAEAAVRSDADGDLEFEEVVREAIPAEPSLDPNPKAKCSTKKG